MGDEKLRIMLQRGREGKEGLQWWNEITAHPIQAPTPEV
jgi:hypothetical protein